MRQAGRLPRRQREYLHASVGKMLTDPEGLGMIEAVESYTGKKIGPTYLHD